MMNHSLIKPLLFILFMICSTAGQADEPIYHKADSMLFEIIENGEVSNKHVSLEFNANKGSGTQWAECLITIITADSTTKRMELNHYYVSTDQMTIRNVSITSKAISFDMMPFPLAPDRPLRFVATRGSDTSDVYKANAVGLWKGLIKESNLLKVEWRQVPSISLPYSVIGK